MQSDRLGVPSCSHSRPVLVRARRTAVRVVCNKAYEASARVKGGVARVYKYVSDIQHMPEWYPGVVAVQQVRGEGVRLGNQYTVNRKILMSQQTSQCEVSGLEPGKKVIVSASAPWYDAMHELYFMADPNDRNYTNIRYIMRLQLKSAAGAIQPLLSGFLSKIPEQGLSKLRQLFLSPDTPLRHIKLDLEEEADEFRAAKSWAAGLGSAASNWSWQSVWEGVSEGLSIGPVPTPNSGSTFVDSMGYYAILGLDPKRRNRFSDDEIKSAYRKAAMELHPDKAPAHDTRAKESATIKFRQLQRAYGVLKNPEHKKMYDAGDLVEELVS